MNPKLELIYQEYVGKLNNFADEHADGLNTDVKTFTHELIKGEYQKEVNAVKKHEIFLTKSRNELFKIFIKASGKIAEKTKSKHFYKRFYVKLIQSGLVEEVVTTIFNCLYQRNKEQLETLMLKAYEILHQDDAQEAVEQPTTAETETIGEQSEAEETSEESTEEPTTSEEKPQTEEAPEGNAETEQEKETADEVTDENEETVADTAPETNTNEEPSTSLTSEQKALPSFYRAGGKSGNKSK